MTCCVEEAVIAAMRELTCTPVRSENHFTNIRKCSDCYPYAVVSSTASEGLRTSSARQLIHTVTVSVYFAGPSDEMAMSYRTQFEAFIRSSKCLELSTCGCICIRRIDRSVVSAVSGGVFRYQCVFTGHFKPAEESVSASA